MTIEPFEARQLAIELPATDEIVNALKDVCIAVNGFPYPGDRSEAIVQAVAWLRTKPEYCAKLGLGNG